MNRHTLCLFFLTISLISKAAPVSEEAPSFPSEEGPVPNSSAAGPSFTSEEGPVPNSSAVGLSTRSLDESLISLFENDDESVAAMEQAYEHLTELQQHPLNINTVEVDELLLIPGVTIDIISDIIEYREKYGNMRSIDELNMIPSIDDALRQYLKNFLCVPSSTEKRWRTKHDITATAAIPTYYRAGDRNSGSAKYANRYLGDPIKHSLRYSLTIGDNISVNLTGAKSAGEPFFSNGNSWGYDRYAYNVSVRNLGICKKLIAGTFRARFGMGLVLNNNFSLSKGAMASTTGRVANDISPYSGTSDGKRLQGAAASLQVGKVTVTALLSYRFIDATLNKDSTIATVLTSSYHRLQNDMNKKNNSTQFTTAMHLAYPLRIKDTHLSLGASFLFSHFNRKLNPNNSSSTISHRTFYPQGRSFWNASIDYSFRWKSLSLSGETATGDSRAVATVNTLSYNVSRRLSLTAVQRYYDYHYYALYGSSFSEGGAVQNESGVYLGATWKPMKQLAITAYGDIAYFPWLRYGVSNSSYAYDASVNAEYSLKKWGLALRYRFKSKYKDIASSGGLYDKTANHHLRLTAALNNKRWTAKTQLEGVLYTFHDKISRGVIVAQSVGCKLSKRYLVYLNAAYFNTSDYDSRLYTYERSMRYSFGYTSYYGHGIHAALVGEATLSRVFSLTAKASHTRYFDRATIGTAERMIQANNQTDLDLQLRIKL
ncbi:MAG: helix-hairpin-helix domain-containing protein [Prevotella sp.]|nr:helix-hairpin-helix domain-containing protein [Candidatus Prevotella equi]